MGLRLREAYTDPKSLLEFGGETLLRRHIRLLNEFGVKQVVIVVGYQKEKIINHIGDKYNDTEIKFIHNEAYKLGNIVSLWAAREEANSDIIILDADVLYDKKILKSIVENEHKSCLMMDINYPNIGDEYLIIGEEGKIHQIGFGFKRNEGPASGKEIGEEVGFTKLSEEHVKLLFQNAEEYLRENNEDLWEELLSKLIEEKKITMKYLTTNNLEWVQINHPEDLEQARLIYSKMEF